MWTCYRSIFCYYYISFIRLSNKDPCVCLAVLSFNCSWSNIVSVTCEANGSLARLVVICSRLTSISIEPLRSSMRNSFLCYVMLELRLLIPASATYKDFYRQANKVCNASAKKVSAKHKQRRKQNVRTPIDLWVIFGLQ